jgi:predicted lipase
MKDALKYAVLSEKAYSDNIEFPGYKSHFISVGTTQLYVLISEEEQIVVFRGTEGKLQDIVTDLKVRKNAGIHRGFLHAYELVACSFYKYLDCNKKITFTGHSLGGALAILACAFHSGNSSAITFGAPRVFGMMKAKQYKNKKILRVENAGDPVPFVPLWCWGYRHIGDSSYLTVNIQNAFNPAPFTPFMNMFFSSIRQKATAHSIKTYIDKLKRIV